MTDREVRSTATAATAPSSGMSRGIAHAVTVVLALLVGGFSLLFILSRAQEDGARAAHPLDPLLGLYDAVGGVGAFVFVSLFWIAFFMVLTELLACVVKNRTAGLRTAVTFEVVVFALFLALWYLPQRIG
jgi:hypothetical protein